jgi:cholesterol transport system auxiliary component
LTRLDLTGITDRRQPAAFDLSGFLITNFCFGRALAVAAILAAALGTAGCVGGSNKALDTFDLAVPAVQQGKRQQANVQILVAEPQALKILDSESIVVRENAASVAYLNGAQWADRLPKIVQSRLVQAFENSRRFGGVGRPGEGLAIDYQVLTDIRAFEIDGAKAVVRIFVKMLNDRNGDVVASKMFEAAVPAGTGNAGIVNALDAAFASTAADIVAWVSATL